MIRGYVPFLLCGCICLSFSLVGQIKEPVSPGFKEPSVIHSDQPYYFELPEQTSVSSVHGSPRTPPAPAYKYNNPHGGMPMYATGASQNAGRQASLRYIQERMRNDPAYNTPGRDNGHSNLAMKKQQAVMELLNEVYSEEKNRRYDPAFYNSPAWAGRTRPYKDALQSLNDQLSGRKKLSMADAYFTVEHAYSNTYLSTEEYNRLLNESAAFITIWMAQNGYNPQDNLAKHLAIQRFMHDTLKITIPSPDRNKPPSTTTHYPFFYDYEDFKGEQDHRNYFLTKCLATGSGQCNSLPASYNALAERLGAKSYLSFAPNHSFIKYPDTKGNIHSYEPTSNWSISDKWYEDHLFISPEAKRSGIYLDTLSRKQIVANCALDLAFGYMKKHGAADGKFVTQCIKTAMEHFPRQNNIYAYFVASSMLARKIERLLYENSITNIADIHTVPEAVKLQELLIRNEEIIKKLGYRDMPDQHYEALMDQHNFRAKVQRAKGMSGKEKRTLFVTSYD